MKMQRSQSEAENAQFVQELAEVDGPFESPININFRELTKLELPSLVWNRAEVSPKKMKITNTGHTVIISGKWKCERPYLSGGPLSGKYVFSQIHFHWGQDECQGSEHQVCGEGFPLEMHVAHFKTEYLTQECALREKDGMVVVVYLFKLQEEPNNSLKKILNLLPQVRQASTSYALDPKPILSLCHPFTDDYFMYWGSVVTSTCAHILLWIISREPFGISKDQVEEFRKILDASHQPIQRNSRDIQPLHRRNVFHVNASKRLDEPLLPVKKLFGCFCKGGEDSHVSHRTAPPSECSCQTISQTQEDVEGNCAEHAKGNKYSSTGGCYSSDCKGNLRHDSIANQSIIVQTATIHSVPMIVKRFDSEPVGNQCCVGDLKQVKSEGDTQVHVVSKSCCFYTTKEVDRIKVRTEKRKVREKKKPFASARAFSHLMDSLEAIKNQTFKKLKEIESINQEIKGMKPFCHDTEDKRWIRRIEKMISKQKRFTLNTSQGYFSDLKKLARECNFDKFFDGKAFQMGDNNQKMMWLNDNEMKNGGYPYSLNCVKEEGLPRINMAASKNYNAIKFSTKAQKLIQSFFEDIKESEELLETVKKEDLQLKKVESYCGNQAGDSNSTAIISKGYITQKMFISGNLGDRFFTAVSTDEFEIDGDEWQEKKEKDEVVIVKEETASEKNSNGVVKMEGDGEAPTIQSPKPSSQEIMSTKKSSVPIEIVKAPVETTENIREEPDTQKTGQMESTGSESLSSDYKPHKLYSFRDSNKKSTRAIRKKFSTLTSEKVLREFQTKTAILNLHRSSSNLSSESTETQGTILSKVRKRQSRKEMWDQKPSVLFNKISSKDFYDKQNDICYSQRKTLKKRKSQRFGRLKNKLSLDLSSTSKDELKKIASRSKWKALAKAKFKLDLDKSSQSIVYSSVENSPISPERKKLKLESKKAKAVIENECTIENKDLYLRDTKTRIWSDENKQSEDVFPKKENLLKARAKSLESNSADSQFRPVVSFSKNESEDLNWSQAGVGVVSTKKLLRASSAESRISSVKTQELTKSKEIESPLLRIEPVEKETQILAVPRIITKNLSLTNIPVSSRFHSTEIGQRIFVETLDKRRHSAREMLELRKKEIPKKTEDKPKTQTPKDSYGESSNELRKKEIPKKTEDKPKAQTPKDFYGESSNETDKKLSEDQESKDAGQISGTTEKSDGQTVSEVEYNVSFVTTAAKQIDAELLPKTIPPKGKSRISKRIDKSKFFVTAKGLEEGKKEYHEIPQPTDLNKSSSKDASKGDAYTLFPTSEDPLSMKSKERPSSMSYSALDKTPTSRHHSVETLVSLKKPAKRKSKKRPHCVKRSSKHYIRKNSSIFKKPNKVESKQLQLLNLPDEEQIKIISANVAKYLKQKLIEQNSGSEKKYTFKDIEEVLYNNLIDSKEKSKQAPQENPHTAEEPEIKEEETLTKLEKERVKKTQKKTENKDETAVITSEEPKKEKTLPTSPKPVHNFIKRNKQMAGKYKRTAEKPAECKKKEGEKPKAEAPKSKLKPPNKKKEKDSDPKQDDQPKGNTESTSPQKNEKPPEKLKKGSKIKPPRTLRNSKKSETEGQKTGENPVTSKPEPEPETKSETKSEPKSKPKSEQDAVPKIEKLDQPLQCNNSSELSPPAVLRKIPQPKKRLVPAYMMTSYLPAPIEIVEGQKRKMNKYLLNMSNTNLENYLPDMLYEVKNRKRDRIDRNDPVFEKELEYLIKLQMCLNEEITTNIENSMNYVKTLFNSDYPVPYLDTVSNNKGVVLVEMKDLDCSSSGTDLTEDLSKFYLGKDLSDNKKDKSLKEKQMLCIEMPKESGDSRILNRANLQEVQEDFNSDSSYDCKISITLNPNTKEGDAEMLSHDTVTGLQENSNSQMTIHLEGSVSQSKMSKAHRKKRKENEISSEMKRKLLEILEGEIKREIGIVEGSSEDSSEGPMTRWEDSDGNNRSQSTDSSCDNMEMLTQISETMKQYLSDFKERRLGEIITESSDKDDESAS